MFHDVGELGPFTSASHRAINCIRVMPVSMARPLMISSISENEDAIKPRDFLDGRPGFFGASEGVGVEGWDVLSATTGVDDTNVDVDCIETGGMKDPRNSSSGPPVGFTGVKVAVETGVRSLSDPPETGGTEESRNSSSGPPGGFSAVRVAVGTGVRRLSNPPAGSDIDILVAGGGE